MARNWSKELAEQFDLRLPDDVVSWLDAEVWKKASDTSFGLPVSPADIGNSVWGGQMLPDTLPILANGCGDYLCLRFAYDGTVTEVIRWLHEGGLWTSYGNTLAEALLFDAAVLEDQAEIDALPFVDWVLQGAEGTIPSNQFRRALDKDGRPSLPGLLRAGLAETAVRWKLCERSCMSGLEGYCRSAGSHGLATKLGIDRREVHKWFFDTAMVPDEFKGKLASTTGQSEQALLGQDWDDAKEHADRVIRLRADLSWPFAVSGWAVERQGDRALAVKLYESGMSAFGSAAEFTENWGRPGAEGHAKFVIDRLCDLRDQLPAALAEDGYLLTTMAADRYASIREHWLHRGEEAEREGRYDRAYWCYYRAGWDIFFTNDMALILDRLQRVASAAGWRPLERLARHHRHRVA